ncbi:MAG TPA: sugar ABC transporter permease [Anaerolineae bacterium]|nr:sugar ABC transporter permease [Anaerolineae bacterium]HOQ97583.1 sugar ABC transporter permease [Anaerolineae bacterium]HPL30641.1 sugar ABC transporter permease [Anaerolineae bacterium]
MIESYGYTLSHYCLVGAGLGLAMLVAYRVLRLFGVKGEAATGVALVLPWVLGFLIWTLGPILASLYFSFTDYDVLQAPTWVGTANYATMFTADPDFWPSMRLTFLYGLLSVPLGMAGALGTALLLAQDIKGIGIWRTIYYLPAVLPAAATAVLWRWMFSPSAGLINTVLSPLLNLFSLARPAWFTDVRLVLPSFVIMSLWGVFGANTVILLAGIKNIPRHLYEAAEIDGAGRWAQFLHVTLPMLSPTLFYTLVVGIIAAMQVFTQPMFINAPRQAGLFMNVYIYQQAFGRYRMGYAAALGWWLLVVILVLTLLVFRSSAAWVYYEGERKR